MIITVLSLAVLIFVNPEAALGSMIAGAEGAVRLAVTLCAIYAVWLSVLKLAEDAGLTKRLARLFKPLIRRLFPGESEAAHEAVTLNFSANLFGMGGAATPAGIKAIESMQKRGDGRATDNMCMFIVINCTSIQLLPGTVIALRAAAGSAAASDIILPSLIATTASTLSGTVLCWLLKRRGAAHGIFNRRQAVRPGSFVRQKAFRAMRPKETALSSKKTALSQKETAKLKRDKAA